MTPNRSRPLPGAAGAKLNRDWLSVASHADTSLPVACLQAGLDLASLGVSVFPLTRRKKPVRLCRACAAPGACPGRDECTCPVNTCHGFYAATTDPDTILQWWTRHPEWQMGIRTGAASGLVVLDVDLDKGGLTSLIALQRAGLYISGTAVQLSGSGRSFHLIYAHPGGYVPCSVGRLGPGLDLRGDGGYVVGAPSIHGDTGAPYELLGSLTGLPAWQQPAEPQPLRRSTRCRQGAGATAQIPPVEALPLTAGRLNALVASVREAQEGQRRNTLFWAACRLGECAGKRDALIRAARLLQQAALDAGLDPAETYANLLDGIRVGRSR